MTARGSPGIDKDFCDSGWNNPQLGFAGIRKNGTAVTKIGHSGQVVSVYSTVQEDADKYSVVSCGQVNSGHCACTEVLVSIAPKKKR